MDVARESIFHHFISVFHLSCLIHERGSVKCTEGLKKQQFFFSGRIAPEKKNRHSNYWV